MDTLDRAGLAVSQRALIERLKRLGEATLAELGSGVEVGRETARGHLERLIGRRLVERGGVRRGGRGRPEVVYRLTAEGDALFPRREGELLEGLARYLVAAGESALLEGYLVARGAERRSRLAHRLEGLDEGERLREAARALSEEGFLAEAGFDGERPATLKLCNCPLRGLVEVTRLPCQAEREQLEALLGAGLERTHYRPDGDACCAYAFAPPPRPDRSAPGEEPCPT